MTNVAHTFDQHRQRLTGIAYRMLGSRADADDVLQDAWLRWHESAPDDLRSAEAWLVTTVTRLSLDRLRARKAETRHYVGPWLPEPLDAADPITPESRLELADNLSIAFIAVLERLTPDERAAFLLREVFDYDYPEVAKMLERNEAACRQLVHRAKARVGEDRPRFTVDRAAHLRVLRAFMAAAQSGRRDDIESLLAEDAIAVSDGGGKTWATIKPLQGAARIAWLYYAVARNPDIRLEWREGIVNGEPAILRFREGALHSTLSIVTDGERVVALYGVLNPDKLADFNADPAVTGAASDASC
ncbi:MAG: sigma-70 family RNA polymerase sigma factor [Methyloversatilis sp.]|jgi:RNA polymerase sigma-70 factor (ECF subfamily)|uniref:RNA polymerase, sigma-24 subunit, ECF subfamily n=1 Tax=Methyloversatilis universalis (strain ATCC BAA-1314 / DSM 25237 / JCM 13912 / CCUG 52030 / FAM5) TaxID=1000565 RepID=F5RGX2_METUF|nr:RNA polymerase sigma factor SigJ [Methyloversatilis universalis]EGK70176.1 RNA polymerase, sigma-24 subunit, ECF subfamily [Methyloversatilis universalis FAM5]MCP4637248.1 sigma-70 family RNA polymerase sigma factor [Methyloversatilis sp.]